MFRTLFLLICLLLLSPYSQADTVRDALINDLIHLQSKIYNRQNMSVPCSLLVQMTIPPQYKKSAVWDHCNTCMATTNAYGTEPSGYNYQVDIAPEKRSVFSDLYWAGDSASKISLSSSASDAAPLVNSATQNGNLTIGQMQASYVKTWQTELAPKFADIQTNLSLAKNGANAILKDCAGKDIEALASPTTDRATNAIKSIDAIAARVHDYVVLEETLLNPSNGILAGAANKNTTAGQNLGALDDAASAGTGPYGGQSSTVVNTPQAQTVGTSTISGVGTAPTSTTAILDPAGTGTGLSSQAATSAKADITADQADAAKQIVNSLGSATVTNGQADLPGYSISIVPKAGGASISDSTLTSVVNLCSSMANGDPDIFAQCTDQRGVDVNVAPKN